MFVAPNWVFNQFYFNSYGTSEYDSRRVMFFVYEIEKLELVKEGHLARGLPVQRIKIGGGGLNPPNVQESVQILEI